MNVSAIIVTRGDHEDGLVEIIHSLPTDWEILVWDNRWPTTVMDTWIYETGISSSDLATGRLKVVGPRVRGGDDVAVYGRYAAIEFATHDLIYVQDDDVIVSDPQAIVSALLTEGKWAFEEDGETPLHPISVACNMPQEFRHDFYTDHALVGFGAAFHRDAPRREFQKWWQGTTDIDIGGICMPVWGYESPTFVEKLGLRATPWLDPFFQRTCDIVFTGLTPRVLVDVPKRNLDYASGDDRMYRQPDHVAERAKMRELVSKVREAR